MLVLQMQEKSQQYLCFYVILDRFSIKQSIEK